MGNFLHKKTTCGDCGVPEGSIHELGCDMEKCPFCGMQLISCDCAYKLLGFKFNPAKEFCGLPKDIYEKGLSDELEEKWRRILEERGRIPYIRYPVICARCGKLYPDLFMVPDRQWEKYVEKGQRDKVLCRECYEEIKSLINEYKRT